MRCSWCGFFTSAWVVKLQHPTESNAESESAPKKGISRGVTLWLCQAIAIEHGHRNSECSWVFPLTMGGSFHSYVNVYQRGYHGYHPTAENNNSSDISKSHQPQQPDFLIQDPSNSWGWRSTYWQSETIPCGKNMFLNITHQRAQLAAWRCFNYHSIIISNGNLESPKV